MLEIGEYVGCIREEEQPEECGNGNYNIDLCSLQRHRVGEIGDQKRNPREEKIPDQERIMERAAVVRTDTPDRNRKDVAPANNKNMVRRYLLCEK